MICLISRRDPAFSFGKSAENGTIMVIGKTEKGMRKDHVRKAAICFFTLFFVFVSMVAGMVLTDVQAQETIYTPRPSVSGKLHVENTYLADEKGNPAALRGLSAHGLTWYPGFINEDLFRQVSEE